MVSVERENPLVSDSRLEILRIDDIQGLDGGDPPSDALVKSIEAKGVINLPTVRCVSPGVYEVVDGRRRLRALKILDFEEAEVVVNPEVEDADGASLVSNYLRSENVLQAARVVWKKMDRGDTERDIATEEGIKIEIVRALRDMRKLRPELIEAVELGKMKPWAARMAARHDPDTTQQELVDRYIKNGKVTADDVKEARSVKRQSSLVEVGDLFEDLPEYEGTGDDMTDDEEYEELPATQDNPNTVFLGEISKVKISRQDRLKNAVSLVQQARKELLAIKSNVRNAEEIAALSCLDSVVQQLTIREG